MQLTLVVPGDLPGPSGGSIYNDQLAEALAAAGHRVTVREVPGAWPRAGRPDHQLLAAALKEGAATAERQVILVDGLMASAAPGAVKSAVDAGRTVWVLLHLPLPAESGLTEQDAVTFAASEREALQHASGVICTSDWARADLVHRYPLERVHVAHPGTNPAEVAQGSTPPQLLMLGSLTPRKNHRLVLLALAGLTDLPWTAAVVGGAPAGSRHAASLRDLAAQCGRERVAFHGVLTGPALDAQWDRTDLVLLPSLAETFGMVVTEGLSRGIPAVVGEGTGAVEALTGTAPGPVPGAVVDPSDPEQLTFLLRTWLSDAAQRTSWRRAALRRRDKLPTWSTTATTIVDIISN